MNWLQTQAPDNKIVATKTIYADKPTKMDIDVESGGIKARIRLEFKKGCVDNDVEVIMSYNPATTELNITPNVILSEPVKLDYYLDGLNLPDSEIDFVYFTFGDNYETVDRRKLKVDVKQGKIMLKDAELRHFSRFGFLR